MAKSDNSAPKQALPALDRALAARREQELADQQSLVSRRTATLALWQELEPTLIAAIGVVDQVLIQHGYSAGITRGNVQFYPATQDADPKTTPYGVMCTSPGVPDGRFPVFLWQNCLYVGGSHRWNEGYTIDLSTLSVDELSNAISETVRWLITEQ